MKLKTRNTIETINIVINTKDHLIEILCEMMCHDTM